MKISEFCFKVTGTCVILFIALWIALKFIYFAESVKTAYVIGAIGFISLVAGLISYIWENKN